MLSRWLKLAGKVIRSNLDRLKSPYKLTYVVTKECHSRCLNCEIWKVKPENELTLGEVELLAKNSPFLSWVDFTGGEPTDRQDFVELVNVFCRNCSDLLFVHFPTNGLKTRRIVQVAGEIVKRSGRRLIITVSIDGPPELNDRLRGIAGDFRQAVETYRRLKTLNGVSVYIGMTLYADNVFSIEETVKAIQAEIPSFGYRDLHINLGHLSDHYYGNHSLKKIQTEALTLAVDNYIKKRGMVITPFELVERMYQKRIKTYLESGLCPQRCAALMASCYLAEDGTVYPCALWNKPLGNIRDSSYSLLELLHSKEANELRAEIICKKCPNCWTPCEAYQTLAANLLRRGQ
ncbi:MAG: radical SAM protein [Candidatus Dadabacteria bacterium]|nr:MAG: radical SAM protein [Candidatus Dadabacteria bacterium]